MSVRLVEENRKLSLGIYRIEGIVDLQEIMAFRKASAAGPAYRYLIMDFTAADVSGFDSDRMKELIAYSIPSLEFRRGGSTIIVSGNETNWFSLRLFCELAAMCPELPVTFHLVADFESARTLLSELAGSPSE